MNFGLQLLTFNFEVLINNVFNTFLYQPILSSLTFLYHLLGDSFGLAIIVLTLLIKGVMAPLTIPAIKSQKKIQELQPKLQTLKKKHQDKKKLQLAQMELYKSHGVNPGAGCLPQIVQIIILITLYRVFLNFLNGGQIDGTQVNMQFLWLDLAKPDPYYVLPVIAGLSQLLYSLMLRPGLEHPHQSQKRKTKKEKKTQQDEKDMAQEIQSQMMFMMPLMTTLIALRFPSGLALYWVISTIFSFAQQYLFTGPGGLKYYWNLAKNKLTM